jgi:hypothetical protein
MVDQGGTTRVAERHFPLTGRAPAQLAAGSLTSLRGHIQNPTTRSVHQHAFLNDCWESANADA